jgi:hypothetical protein
MSSSDTALVKYDWENVRRVPDNRWLEEPSREVNSLYNLAVKLIGLLLAAAVFLGAVYAYEKVHHFFNGGDVWIAREAVNIRSAPVLDPKTVLEKCDEGTRFRIIGTKHDGVRKWYEVEVVSHQSETLSRAPKKWVVADYVIMPRK